MTRVPFLAEDLNTSRVVLNVESIGLSSEQFFRLCRDFAPICPDFVIELWSPSDILKEIQFKMTEYRDNGTQPGFLIYPPQRQVYVYRPNQPAQCLDQPSSVSGDPELPGFALDLTEIWQ